MSVREPRSLTSAQVDLLVLTRHVTAAADRCLGDNAMAQRLAAQTAEARRLGISGTPGFLLNGDVLAGTHDWKTLQVQLKARVADPTP